MSRRTLTAATALIIVLVAAIALVALARPGSNSSTSDSQPGASPAPAVLLGERTKTSGCTIAGALPDRGCTPGAIFPGATREQICRSGYSSSVRNVSEEEKRQVYAEYGIRTHPAGAYEVDHLISLELGGSNDISNLWPEAASPPPGFHQKDRYENYAHQQVCSGAITLQEAQRRISEDWLKYWTDAGTP